MIILKFKYSLQSVLDFRQQTEDKKREVFISVNNKALIEKKNLENIKGNLNDTMQKASNNGFSNIHEHRHYVQYMMNLENKVNTQKVVVNEYEEKAKIAQKDYEHAQKERKIMELLQEKEIERYVKEMKRKEENELNEMANQRYNMAKLQTT